mmetsp:Transcript_23584/g.41121  ORF Transcript_23584/g.41121 Transcript_23584/m.41121 type:complete len:81 (-) Transcript_23584:327-569(-)
MITIDEVQKAIAAELLDNNIAPPFTCMLLKRFNKQPRLRIFQERRKLRATKSKEESKEEEENIEDHQIMAQLEEKVIRQL